MQYKDVLRLIDPVVKRIQNIITRSILDEVDDSENTQTIKVKGLKNEIIDDIERLQEFGLSTHPNPDGDAEAILLSLRGNRDVTFAIKVNNRAKRPKDLEAGETMLYGEDSGGTVENYIKISPTDDTILINTTDGNIITIDTNGVNITCKNGNEIDMTSSGMTLTDLNGNTIETSTTKVTINSNLEISQ